VKLLVEEGSANVQAADRWDQTPLDEARRLVAGPVVVYLQGKVGPAAAAAAADKHAREQTEAMLDAASKGRVGTVKQLLARGCPADAADYDRRTGLMLAAANGHRDVVTALLAAGANPNARDNLNGSPLLEAVKCGWQDVVRLLVGAGASLQLSTTELSSALCSMVQEEQVDLLRRYIAAGADMNAADYDKRAPLHVAAAEGRLPLVVLLVEEGGADLAATDRWGNTPLAEARRAGAADVVAYLSSSKAKAAAAAAAAAGRSWRGHEAVPGPPSAAGSTTSGR
jgi:ankyrin repeat protein